MERIVDAALLRVFREHSPYVPTGTLKDGIQNYRVIDNTPRQTIHSFL
jgi:hypothetical protein